MILDILIHIVTYIVIVMPTISEGLWIDQAYWDAGKDDKPMSTYIRGLMMILLSVAIGLVYQEQNDVNFWLIFIPTFLVTFLTHVLFFAFLINYKKGKPLDYLGTGDYDEWIRKIPLWKRLTIAGILWVGSIVWFEVVT
jgi:ribose/xylose/arabinose/galactoside ABC-type transport system permease subunit